MKVKFLLSALTMPMIFAACTNDELMDNQASVSLDNRTPLGDVELTFGNLDSRLALQDGSWYAFDWANGDDLGASLIDVRNTTPYDENTNPIEYYNLTTTPQTNYRYEYKDGSWTSNAAMVEGNYVFYMPYVENTSRQATLAVLPSTQKLEKVTIAGEETYTTYNSVLEDAKENGHVMAVGYKFLSAAGENEDGNKTISVSFKQLYATPLITIQNWAQGVDGEMTDLTINKIKLSLTKNGSSKRYFQVKDYLKYTDNVNVTATTEAWTKNDNSIVDCLNGVLNPDDEDYIGGSWNNLNLNKTVRTTAQLLQGFVDNTNHTERAETITINLEDSVTIASKASFSFYAVIPGGAYTNAGLGQLVVTLVTTDNEQVSVTLPEVNINPGKRYAVEAYASDAEVGTGAAALTAVTTEQLTPAPVETGVEIATQEELYTAIATAKKVDLTDDGVNNPDKVDMEFIVNGDITLNDQVITMMQSKTDIINSVTFKSKDVAISALSKTVNIPITIKKNVSISGSVNAVLLNSSDAAGNKIKVEGNVTVASGAEAVLCGEIKKITNNGTLTLDYLTTTTNDVTNNGTLNLNANLTATNKNINNAANATINVKATSTVDAKKLTNKGALNIIKTTTPAVDGVLTISAEIENQKTIAVAGTMTASGKFTNKANATINVTGTLTASDQFTNSGDITITEGATMTATATTTVNRSKIDVAGTLDIYANADTITLSNSSKFGTNKVTVQAVAKNTAGTAEVWGTILNANGKTVDAVTLLGTTKQRVWKSYEALTGEQDWEVATTYNAVKYNGATIAAESAETVVPCKLVYAEFNGNSTLVVTGAKNVGMPQIIQVNQELAIEGASTLVMPSTGAEINIAKNATLGWNDVVVIKSDGAILITNKGKVYCNAGSVTDVDATSTGVWATGTTGNAAGWIGIAATVNQ